jgi:2',3'-cyclic-nucleotide 2'-phosphodiesterase (5'-nucleotidase family)
VTVSGADVRKQLERFASRNNYEALGGIEMEVRDGKITRCLVGGQPLDDNKEYKLATIDFLLGGGDKVFIGSRAVPNSLVETGIVLRDAVVNYLKRETAEGRKLTDRKDGRIVVHKN